jgi:UDP-glucose 4-epimerase
LELARTLGIKRIIFSSSREVYGNEVRQDAYPEHAVRIEHCESPYTASKISGEAFVESYVRCYGLDAVIFRFSNVYGMYDDSERVVPLFIRRAQKNETLTVFGKDKRLDFTYIDDNIHGMILGIEKFDTARGQIFNLGNSEGTTVVELAETVKRLKKSSSPIVLGESRRGEVTHYVADISKAKSVLGYKPVTPFAIGIKKAVEWYEAHPC